MKKLCNVVASLAVGASLIGGAPTATAASNVSKIYDGDTITMSNGDKVRLIQIDTPELDSKECYAETARKELVKLLSKSEKVSLIEDPNLDKVDRYGRSLRYVFVGNININLKMIEIGAAAPYFYNNQKGAYSDKMMKAALNAQKLRLGLWKACPGTQLTPNKALQTLDKNVSTSRVTETNSSCDSNYAGCIPSFPPDLDCSDIKRLKLAPVKVIGKDVHKLDKDGDGIGCNK